MVLPLGTCFSFLEESVVVGMACYSDRFASRVSGFSQVRVERFFSLLCAKHVRRFGHFHFHFFIIYRALPLLSLERLPVEPQASSLKLRSCSASHPSLIPYKL